MNTTVYYSAPTYSTYKTAPVYSKILVPVKPAAKTQTSSISITFGNDYKASTYTAPKAPVKPDDPDGTICSSDYNCKSSCCSRNLFVMPREGVEDLYALRTQYYNSDTKTYSPPDGKVYTYTPKSAGDYSTKYGCYGGFYYDTNTNTKVSASYDSLNKVCMGNVYKDLNYVDYSS